MSRRYFGTDGVRGIVGAELTPELVERVGKAATLWAGGGRVLVGRDTRASGPELEQAVARRHRLGGRHGRPRRRPPDAGRRAPRRRARHRRLGLAQPARVQRRQALPLGRQARRRATRRRSRRSSRLAAPGGGSVEHLADAAETYLAHVVERFGSDLTGLRIGVDCANGAFSSLAPRAFAELGAEVHAIGIEPDGSNINVGCGATDLGALQELVDERGVSTSESRSTATATACSPSTSAARRSTATRSSPSSRSASASIVVAVTVMTNLGFHRLMAEHGVKRRDHAGRRPLRRSRRCEREGGLLGGEQSGHVIWLGDHVTGDGLAAALLLCGALRGRSLERGGGGDAALSAGEAQHPRQPAPSVPQAVLDEADRLNEELGEQRPRPRAAVGNGARRARPGRGGKCGRCREVVC